MAQGDSSTVIREEVQTSSSFPVHDVSGTHKVEYIKIVAEADSSGDSSTSVTAASQTSVAEVKLTSIGPTSSSTSAVYDAEPIILGDDETLRWDMSTDGNDATFKILISAIQIK